MTLCQHCGNLTYIDLSSVRRCRSCDRTPAWCRCQRPSVATAPTFKPAWLANLTSRDETGRLAA